MRRLALLCALGLASAGLTGFGTQMASAGTTSASAFRVGAASADATPPARSTVTDQAFVPTCATSGDQVQALWTGPRPFAFEEPYIDQDNNQKFSPGEPYCDANQNGRYDAPYVAGGGGQNHWPVATDGPRPVRSQVVVFALGTQRIAMVVVDSIGLFNTAMDQIRQAAAKTAPDVTKVFVSSTHDESAPDPIGLWGPDTANSPAAVSSGVDDYYMQFLADQTAAAIGQADHHLQPAVLKLAEGQQPRNTLSCWSSYPYVDDQEEPVMQAVNSQTAGVIFTMVDVGTHAETLAFSDPDANHTILSADWPGSMRTQFETDFPGSVGIEMASLVGSVEMPNVYEPESTQVIDVPGAPHESGDPNPDGCSPTVYPDPGSGAAVLDSIDYMNDYGVSVAHAAEAALASHGQTFTPSSLT